MSLLAVPEVHVLRILSPDGRLLFATRVVRLFAYGFLAVPLAIAVLLARFSISQMDVPTRQSYIVAVVDPDERSAATGVTTTARTTAAACAPFVSGALLGASWLIAPFLLSGGLKIIYDLLLYRSFRALKPPEER